MEDCIITWTPPIHEYDWYKSGDTNKQKYLDAKAKFKKKWLNNRGVRVRHIIDSAIQELKDELYETYSLDNIDKEFGDNDNA